MTEQTNEEVEHLPLDPPPIPEDQEETYKDKYLRLLAELDNTRKRMQREKQEMTRFAIENAFSDLLEPIDRLESALKMTETLSSEMRNWAQGFLMILGQFQEILAQHGIVSFSSEGELFDPELHYAVETEETEEKPEGTILQVYVKGYRSKERTIRAARVKVAATPSKKEEQQL